MLGGYMGKMLFVDLSSGAISEEALEESLCRDFIGGYGIGARILYSRQKARVNPLGPENILGFVTGPLTGTPSPMGTRFTALAKSPLTGGWGDANCGGHFGPHMKFSGYDAIFVSGASETPVYLFINNGKAEIRDARDLWGKDTFDTEDSLKDHLGRNTEVISIGPSGEKLSLISCIITRRGAAAGRSGLGAVMGSKRLKAIAVAGDQKVPIMDAERANALRKAYISDLKIAKKGGESFFELYHNYGTAEGTAHSAHSGDAPIKNWGGVGIVDFPDTSGLSRQAAVANLDQSGGCWHCPLACEGKLKEGSGEYKYPAGTRRPEYETQGSFGTMCLNNDAESIAMANHICNSYGLDTVSAGCTIAFAIECYENGLISKNDTGGIELTWGNHRSIIAMTERMARREGFGDVLADGTRVAAQKIGRNSEEYAVHIGGQELGMHDPKFPIPFFPSLARYLMDATPGRHTQGFGPVGFRGHVVNAVGICMFGYMRIVGPTDKYIVGLMSAATGREWSMEELLKCGERIATIRHAFNLREGINPLNWSIHPRIIGNPQLKAGPHAGVTIDLEAQLLPNLDALDWDRVTTKPSSRKLLELGLTDVAADLWP